MAYRASVFASQSISPNRPGVGVRQTVRVDDTPIADFVKVIDNTPAGAWQKRTTAFENLIKKIPEGSEYNAPPVAWYNNPPTLRRLANPLSELLKDPRSTVVKRTCGSLLTLFSRCQTDARYLFKDMMATVLSVHAQTVQVIRQAVQFMVMEAIPEVPCKMVMPLWMERLKIDKSRTVRDACALYLGQALICWTDEGYLTEEIWLQVGRCLIGSLRDPSPAVRSNSKSALESMQRMQPEFFQSLIDDPEGAAAKDHKLAKWLNSLGMGDGPDPEELSIMSRISYNSDIRASRRVGSSGASVGSNMTPRRHKASPRGASNHNVPSSIALGRKASPVNLPPSGSNNNGSVSKKPPAVVTGSAIPTPTRRADLFARREEEELAASTLPSSPSPRAGGTPGSLSLRSPDHPAASPMADSVSPMATGALTPDRELDGLLASDSATDQEPSGENDVLLSPTAFPADLGVPALRETMQPSPDKPPQPRQPSPPPQNNNTADSPPKPKPTQQEGPVADMQAFSQRRSRNSILIQQRLKMSSSSVNDHSDGVLNGLDDDENNAGGNNGQNGSAPKPPVFPNAKPHQSSSPIAASVAAALPSSPGAVPPPEHMVIAIRLLKAHKAHVDAIMETLRIEMDTLRDFDRLLEEPGRPTEDEVLDYFESVGLCLEQRTMAGVQMQEELDRVSRGEPPSE